MNNKFIADERILLESPSPEDIYCYSPALCHGFAGRMIASFDFGGPGTTKLEGPRSDCGDRSSGNQLRILTSDDRGESWTERARLPMLHTMLFKAGNALYAIGHSGRLVISRSLDNGSRWSAPFVLESEHTWHQNVCRVDVWNGRVTLVYDHRLPRPGWPNVAPVLMSADENADLCKWENWSVSEPFDPTESLAEIPNIGMPFESDDNPGILESNVFRIHDPDHVFYDPSGESVMVLARAHTGMSNYGALLRGIVRPGEIRLEKQRTPGGGELFLLPLPGGQMKFYLDYDPVSKLYWMAATQTTDSFRRLDLLPPGRMPTACNQRRRLMLQFSRNGFDWCFAGLVAEGAEGDRASRHYASFLFDGDDILILSRSGDGRARNSHDGNLLTLHRVRNFRNLVC